MIELLSPGRVLEHLRTTDRAQATLESAFSHCTGLDGDQRLAWTNFSAEYSAFSKRLTTYWSGLNATTFVLINAAGGQLALHTDDDKILAYEHQFAGWQTIAASKCGLNVPGITPRDDPGPEQPGTKTAEHIAIAGAVIVTGVVLLVGVSYLRKFF